MGFVSGLVSGITNAAKKIGDIAHKVADVGGKVVNILSKPEEALSGFVKKAAGGLLDRLPFGLGNMLKPVADKLIDNGLSLLDKGPLSGVMAFAKKIAPNVKQLADFAETVSKKAQDVGAFQFPSSLSNLQEMFSSAQADALASKYAL
jgi:hypothetical protein